MEQEVKGRSFTGVPIKNFILSIDIALQKSSKKQLEYEHIKASIEAVSSGNRDY